MTLGEKIKAVRTESGISSPRKLADLIGVTAQAVVLWEADERHPGFRYIERIARVTGKSLDYFAEDMVEETIA